MKKSGFEKDPCITWPKRCISLEHNPPTHMVIPQGQVYRHICPMCGYEVVLRPNVSWGYFER